MILVSFSAMNQLQTAPIAAVSMVYSLDNGFSWLTVDQTSPGCVGSNCPQPPQWDPFDLDIHCGRGKYFLGEYRDGSVFGEKHYQTLPQSRNGHVTQMGRWSTRRSLW